MFDDNLPPIDHSQGFTTREEIMEYLESFADRPDTDIVSFDIWGRPTLFGDLRRLVAVPQKTMSFNFE